MTFRKKTFLTTALENLAENGQAELTDPNARLGAGEGGEPVPAEAPALNEEDLSVVETEGEAEAEASSEAAEVETALENLEGELDTATDDVVAVSDVAEKLETSAENGGLAPEAADAVQTAMESLISKYPTLKKADHLMPALESFGDVKKRGSQTKYAAENFGEKAKELGNKVLEAIKGMIKWLLEAIQKYLTVAGRLEARAKKIKEAAGKAKDAKQKEVSFGGFLSNAKALAINGSLPANVAGSVEETVQLAFKAAGAAAELKRLIENAKTTAKDAKVDPAKVAKAEEEMASFFSKSASSVDATEDKARTARQGGFDLPESSGTRATQILPGNKVIWGARSAESGGISRFGISVKKQEFEKQSVKTLSIQDIQSIADSAINAASLKKILGDLQKGLMGFNQAIEGAAWGDKVKEAAGNEEKEKEVSFKETAKKKIAVLRDSVALAGAFHRPAVQVALSTASAGLDLAQASLKVYGAAVEAPKEGEDKGGDKGGEGEGKK